MTSGKLQEALDAISNNGSILFHPETKFFRDFMRQQYKLQIPELSPSQDDIRILHEAVEILRQQPQLLQNVAVTTEVKHLKATIQSDAADDVSAMEVDSEEDLEEEQASLEGIPSLQFETEDPPNLPNFDKELPEGEAEARQKLLDEAARAKEIGKPLEALDALTKALGMGDVTAALVARRAEVLLDLQRPVAAIADATGALTLNPNNARALRVRGKAHAALKEWELGHRDLQAAQAVDFEDAIDLHARAVAKQWQLVKAARIARAARREERKCRNAGRAARRHVGSTPRSEARMPDIPGMPQMPSMPTGGVNMQEMLGKMMSNPKLMEAMKNPKVLSAMTDAMANPANLSKHMSDPEVMEALQGIMGVMS